MLTSVSKKFLLKKQFVGEPKESDFELVEEELPELKDNQILIKAEFLSVDPYMRTFAHQFRVGSTMFGSQVAKILLSKSKFYPEGRYIVGHFGWRTHTVTNPDKNYAKGFPKPYLLEDFKGHPYSLALGILGMPGNAAYVGVMEGLQPKPGDVMVVSGAAGCVGSTAGQIGKIMGCKVLGFTGNHTKQHWVRTNLGFDDAFDYRTQDINRVLECAAPDGVDCYFDNVGGEICATVLRQMRVGGRVTKCGNISSYNLLPNQHPLRPYALPEVEQKKLKTYNLSVFSLDQKRWMEGINANLKWLNEGKMKYRETVTHGFENMPRALIGLLRGENVGKALVEP